MKDIFTKLAATAMGVGYSPLVPGTVGTFAAVPLFILLSSWGAWGVGVGLVLCVAVGIPAAGRMEVLTGKRDPGVVVIDEVAGFLLTMLGSPPDVAHIAAGFFLFRFFDILKPPPIRFLEVSFDGGMGIVLDDLAAGAYAWVLLRAFERLVL